MLQKIPEKNSKIIIIPNKITNIKMQSRNTVPNLPILFLEISFLYLTPISRPRYSSLTLSSSLIKSPLHLVRSPQSTQIPLSPLLTQPPHRCLYLSYPVSFDCSLSKCCTLSVSLLLSSCMPPWNPPNGNPPPEFLNPGLLGATG
jgi:hypothetical protein